MITKLIKAETCQHQQDLSACNNNAYCRKKHILCLSSVFHVSLCTTHLAALVIRGISAGRADYIIHKYTALHRSRSCFYNLSYIVGLFWKHTLSRLFKKTTNSSPLTSSPAAYGYSLVRLVCLGGVIRWDVGSQTAGIWFRGKFANVLTRVAGSRGELWKSWPERAFN